MKSVIQSKFVLIALTLLAGCNSEGVFDSEAQPPVVVGATVVEITVTPSPISVLKGRTQQLVAMAKYDDGSEKDVSNSVTWAIVGDPTIADVSDSGLLTGNTIGDTQLTASKDGLVGNAVNVNVCNLAGACIDIFDSGGGKLFSSSPSVDYLDSIGGSVTTGVNSETLGDDSTGNFYLFSLSDANALCATYNTQNIGGRSNWRLATRDELKMELFDTFGYLFSNATGWPTLHCYWSATANYYVFLTNGVIGHYTPSYAYYASCVSNP